MGINQVFFPKFDLSLFKTQVSPVRNETATDTCKGNSCNCFSTREQQTDNKSRKMKSSRVDTSGIPLKKTCQKTLGTSLNKTFLLLIVTITSFEQNIDFTACKTAIPLRSQPGFAAVFVGYRHFSTLSPCTQLRLGVCVQILRELLQKYLSGLQI